MAEVETGAVLPLDSLTLRLIVALRAEEQAEPPAPDGEMPAHLASTYARRYDEWDRKCGAFRILIGSRLTNAALDLFANPTEETPA